MKHKKTLLLILSVMLIFAVTFLYAKDMTNNNSENIDYVPNEETAIKIAEAIWLPIYGDKIYNSKPFTAKLKGSNIWVVQGTLKASKGGVPYIEIQKKDCKILKVTHGK